MAVLWRVIRGAEEHKWPSLCHQGTSPIPRAAEAMDKILGKTIGSVGRIPFPIHIWESTVPKIIDQDGCNGTTKAKQKTLD